MTVLSELEIAENAIRKALVTALNNKQDGQISKLVELLGDVKSTIRECPLTFTDNTDLWYNNMSDYNFNLTSNIDLNTGDVKNQYGGDVIQFASRIPGAASPDTISLG